MNSASDLIYLTILGISIKVRVQRVNGDPQNGVTFGVRDYLEFTVDLFISCLGIVSCNYNLKKKES